MRRRTARFFHREEVKHTNERSMLHPQVVRQIDEADIQELHAQEEADVVDLTPENTPEEFCRVCDAWLNYEEYGDDICGDCLRFEESKAYNDMYGTCDVCGEPIDYCLGGHPYEIEED